MFDFLRRLFGRPASETQLTELPPLLLDDEAMEELAAALGVPREDLKSDPRIVVLLQHYVERSNQPSGGSASSPIFHRLIVQQERPDHRFRESSTQLSPVTT